MDAAWNQFDKEEVEDWKAAGGWLHELADDTLPYTRAAPEVPSHEFADGPVDAGVSAAAGNPRIPQDGGWS